MMTYEAAPSYGNMDAGSWTVIHRQNGAEIRKEEFSCEAEAARAAQELSAGAQIEGTQSCP